MSEQEGAPNPLMKSSFVPFIFGMMAFSIGWDALGICGFAIGIIMLVIAGLSQATAEGFSTAQGKMVLKQDESGQWGWTQTGDPTNSASSSSMEMFDVQSQVANLQPQIANLQPDNQRMKLIISEVRRGNIEINDLELEDVNSIASAFGVQTSSSKAEVIKNLVLSPTASKALKITGATLAGIGALTTVAGAAKVARHVNDKEDLTGKARQAIEDAKEAIAEKKEAVIDDFDSKLDEVITEIETKVEDAEQYLEEETAEVTNLPTVIVEPESPYALSNFDVHFTNASGDPNAWIGVYPAGASHGEHGSNWLYVSGSRESGEGKTSGSVTFAEGYYAGDYEVRLFRNNGHELMASTSFSILPETVVEEEVEVEETAEEIVEVEETVEEMAVEEEVVSTDESQSPPTIIIEAIELDEGINTPLEMAIEKMENARLSSERRAIMAAENSVHMVTLKISKFERTLLGNEIYRGGQSLSGLIDGGPYEGLVKIPIELNEEILACTAGDTITLNARIVDFSPSRRRPVLEATEFA